MRAQDPCAAGCSKLLKPRDIDTPAWRAAAAAVAAAPPLLRALLCMARAAVNAHVPVCLCNREAVRRKGHHQALQHGSGLHR